jgi:hypothetical protein
MQENKLLFYTIETETLFYYALTLIHHSEQTSENMLLK